MRAARKAAEVSRLMLSYLRQTDANPEMPQAFLSKPYEYVELIGAIRQVLAR